MGYALKSAEAAAPGPDRRRWIALTVIALAQLMVALDATIVSIALPSAQRGLQVSDAERPWVITAYTLAFGGLLLLGGRIADTLGRKRTFLCGLAGFAGASALGGSAGAFGVLLAARALQGAFAALLAPTALSLMAVTFTRPRERARAFAVYGSIAGSGAAVGLLLGGLLTQSLSWRWCLYVNLPIAIVAAVGGGRVLAGGRGAAGQRVDLPGAALSTGGLVALVLACTQAVPLGWGSAPVLTLLGTSAGLLALFWVWETHTATPLLPLRLVLHRTRGGAYLAVGLTIAGMFGAFLLLTYYLQVVLGFSPVQAGLGFLPLTLANQLGSWAIAGRLMPRVRPRMLLAPGALLAAAGMAVLTQLPAGGGYWTRVLPAELLLGIGVACVMVPAFNLATLAVNPREAGVASAVVTTATQVGGSLGTALLNAIAVTAAAAYRAGHGRTPAAIAQGAVHGDATAAGFAAALLALAGIVAFVTIDAGKPATETFHPTEGGHQ